ncbi:MAG: PfaD family polyunsaturated fatty acid/polyketide biosynthesis protein [Pseudobacteriovorax sp.]|nr:PfaD family polyunsaturated fatty acid/polyketide biosynthesis protein [Pseudobacteriovorax sp.]
MIPVTEVIPSLWSFQQPHNLPSDEGYLSLPATPLRAFGSYEFCRELNVSIPYVSGAMANGIASPELVIAMARGRLLGFYGAAGLTIPTITEGIETIIKAVGDKAFGVNLIHNPSEPHWEWDLAKLLIQKGIDVIEASAFMKITEPLVYFRCKGLSRSKDGKVVAKNKIMAKISRGELAIKFMQPPEEKLLDSLKTKGLLTEEEISCAREIPLAQYITVESDSGGHTDNRPALTLFPAMQSLAQKVQNDFDYEQPLRLGLAGGIATPQAVASAIAMGASYVVTGSINQACLESGSSDPVRKMLSEVDQADVVMAPAADMFEMGVEVQVMKKGTMFPMRAKKLFEIYKTYDGLESIPEATKTQLEKQIFRMTLDDVWEETKKFFQSRNPELLKKCESRPKVKMGLVFRWYLGLSSRWANQGVDDRKLDYQVWCGPSMGAFNAWTEGSYLADPEERSVVTVAHNLFLVAFALYRLNFLKAQGYSTELVERTINKPLTREVIAQLLQEDI